MDERACFFCQRTGNILQHSLVIEIMCLTNNVVVKTDLVANLCAVCSKLAYTQIACSISPRYPKAEGEQE